MNKRIFRGSILESVLLNLISDNSDHGLYGYAISNTLNKKFRIKLGSSTIYPELRNLEKQGLVTSSWEFALGRARRQYRITRKGQGLVTEYNAELKATIPTSRLTEQSIKKASANKNQI
jgi:DNA-binding PadR family transcriptional regulator